MSVEILIVPALIDLAVLASVLMTDHRRATVSTRMEKGIMTAEELEDMRLQIESLRRSGCDVRLGQETRGSDMLIHTDQGYDIGLRRNEKGAYDVVTHWSQQPGKVQIQQVASEIEDRIKQKYAYEKVKLELAKKGFTISSEQVEQDESIRLVVRKW